MAVNFTVRFRVDGGVRDYCGLEALDLSRRLKLPETTDLVLPNKYSEHSLRVDEAFARRRFPKNKSQVIIRIPVENLVAGDLVMMDSTFQTGLVSSEMLAHHLELPIDPPEDE